MLVLAIPDLHCKYQHEHAWDFLRDLKREVNPDKVICLGDELELAGLSFHDHDPMMPGVNDEFEDSKRELQNLFKIFPEAQVCISNHTSRGFRKAFKAGIPPQFLKDYAHLLDAPKGYSWHSKIIIDDVLYIHGEGYSGKNAHVIAACDHMQSVVIGHIHAWGGVQYVETENRGRIFGINSGCLIDQKALAFKWARHFAKKVTLGASIIEDGRKGHFIPMEV